MDSKTLLNGVTNAITQKPIPIAITQPLPFFPLINHTKRYYIYPPTIGKMQLLSVSYRSLDFDEQALRNSPFSEAMRLAATHTDEMCHMMAVATFKKRKDLLNEKKINKRSEYFKWACSPADIATVIIAMLTQVDYQNFINTIRLTRIFELNSSMPRAAGLVA